jgi:hypothetical protein
MAEIAGTPGIANVIIMLINLLIRIYWQDFSILWYWRKGENKYVF